VQLARHTGFHKIISPDRRYIYFSGGRTDPAIWRYMITTGERKRLLDDLLPGYWPPPFAAM
jgi:hypothetical protein